MRQVLFILALTAAISCSNEETLTKEYAHQMLYFCKPPMHNAGEDLEAWSDRIAAYLISEGVEVSSYRMEKVGVPLPEMVFCGVCHHAGDLLIVESTSDLEDLKPYAFTEY